MAWDKLRVQRIKSAILKKPFLFYFILIFVFYIFLNVFINKIHITFYTLIHSMNWLFVIPYLLFNFIIVPFLVALTVNLSIMRFKELGISRKGSGSFLGSLGAFGGLLGGACPACIAGLFPAFLGLFGVVGFSLNVLPLMGLEIQILSSGLLTWSILLLSKEPVCKI